MDLAVSMAPIPIATPNFAIPDTERNAPVFRTPVPLDLYLCRDCGLLQVTHVGNPNIQYPNYVYRTSSSLGLAEHFTAYAKEVIEANALEAGAFVVEIGSNDGTLLKAFKDAGMKVLGIEPAEAVGADARKAGIDTITDFFSSDVAKQVERDHGKASLVIANNMYANIDELNDFTIGVRDLLAPDGIFVLETQYGLDVIESLLLDTIYHEHLCYFNVKPIQTFFARLGMQVIDVQRIWTKGGSIRLTTQLDSGKRSVSSNVEATVTEEIDKGMYQNSTYKAFADRISGLRTQLNDMVDAEIESGRSVVGYGSSVGTTTLLAQFGLTEKIAFLFDDDPTKDPVLSGPGYDLPLISPDTICDRFPGAVVVFAWRYVDPIKQKNKEYLKRGGKFIVPLPNITVHQSND